MFGRAFDSFAPFLYQILITRRWNLIRNVHFTLYYRRGGIHPPPPYILWGDGWMDGWMDRWMDEWMDGWTDGCLEA